MPKFQIIHLRPTTSSIKFLPHVRLRFLHPANSNFEFAVNMLMIAFSPVREPSIAALKFDAWNGAHTAYVGDALKFGQILFHINPPHDGYFKHRNKCNFYICEIESRLHLNFVPNMKPIHIK